MPSEQNLLLDVGRRGCSHANSPFDGPHAKPHYAPHQLLYPVSTTIRILDINFQSKQIKAHVTHVVSRHATAPADLSLEDNKSLCLNAVGFFYVSVKSGAVGVEVSHNYNGKQLRLTWSKPFQPAEERSVDIEYTIINPVSGLFFSYPDSDYPDMPVYVITDHETERARYWLPCIDYPSVRTTVSFEITSPSSMVALATGELASEQVNGSLKTTKWKLDHHNCPSYLICWAVGEFTRVDDGKVGDIPISYFAPKCFPADDIKRAFDKTPAMIKWLQEKLASPFPWPKYYQIAAADVGGAMENISLVTWNDRFIMDSVWAQERKLIMDLVNIHEMAHTYFGDLIVIRHFDQVWMKESWATYMESVWLEDHMGDDHFRYELYLSSQQYFHETESYMRPMIQRAYKSSWSLFDNHTYPGGACRLHSLRKVMGDNCFWSAVRKYVNKYRGSVVETEDFRKIMEQESGLNLMRFFDQWFYSKGYPQLKISQEFNAEKLESTITIEQTQVSEKNQIPLFNINVEIEVVDEDGNPHKGVVRFESTDETKSFALIKIPKGKPKFIRIDPEGKILASIDFTPGEDLLIDAAKDAKDIVNRIIAYKALVKLGTPSAMKKVSDAIAQEKFYGVRVACAESLGESKTRLACDLLASMLLTEKDPMAQWQIAKQCKISDQKIRSALLKFLETPNLPYRAREFALESLGFQENQSDLDRLLAIAQDNSQLGQHNFVRAGALRALSYFGASPDSMEKVYGYLYQRASQRGLEPYRLARASAVDALSRFTLRQPEKSLIKKTVALLRELALRDPDQAVRKTALLGLVSLDAKEAIGDLESSKVLYAEQDWAWVDAQIKKLTDKKPETNEELKKKIETLESRLRGLEEKLMTVTASK